jgi:2-keto-4-pentenoate hydratase/2-oxohepta-3-ene-1,7-dioic acid hydratase in catechol pathway
MRFARNGQSGQERPVVLAPDGTWRDLGSRTEDITPGFIARGTAGGWADLNPEALPPAGDLGRWGPPIAGITKIVCIGLNYVDHAHETGAKLPAEPILFLKTPDTVIGPNDDVLIPRGSEKTDWEVELAIVIGAEARYLDSPEAAPACIAGYAVSNDVSERHFQTERGGQWDKGKNCETFYPLGPWLVTADEIPDPQQLGLRLSVNGVVRQNGNTANMIFGINHLVWYVSQFMVLRPGDIISTGTPAGVAMGMDSPAYLRAGDVMELEIDHLGTQRQVLHPA